MVKDQEEKVQKAPEVPTICTKECTRSGAPTLVMTESINGRLTALCFADVRQQSINNDLLQEAATNRKSWTSAKPPCHLPNRDRIVTLQANPQAMWSRSSAVILVNI